MGKPNSKPKESTKETNTLVEGPQTITRSSGFHLVEIHLPSVGVSLLALALLVLVVFLVVISYRKFQRRFAARRP